MRTAVTMTVTAKRRASSSVSAQRCSKEGNTRDSTSSSLRDVTNLIEERGVSAQDPAAEKLKADHQLLSAASDEDRAGGHTQRVRLFAFSHDSHTQKKYPVFEF